MFFVFLIVNGATIAVLSNTITVKSIIKYCFLREMLYIWKALLQLETDPFTSDLHPHNRWVHLTCPYYSSRTPRVLPLACSIRPQPRKCRNPLWVPSITTHFYAPLIDNHLLGVKFTRFQHFSVCSCGSSFSSEILVGWMLGEKERGSFVPEYLFTFLHRRAFDCVFEFWFDKWWGGAVMKDEQYGNLGNEYLAKQIIMLAMSCFLP